MARPPLPLGDHGSITVTRSGGKWIARCRVRDLDGRTRKLERWGPTRTAASSSLQDALRERRGVEKSKPLRPTSKFSAAADVWSAKIAERREDSTTETYRFWVEKLVLPRLGELRLHECDVAYLDWFFNQLAREQATKVSSDGEVEETPRFSANSRRTIRSIVSGVLQQAVLHGAIQSNPVKELDPIESPKGHKTGPPRGLTAEERQRLLDLVDSDKLARRADLPDLIRFAIGSGLRIGELCAVRWMDINLEGLPVTSADDIRMVPVVAVRQNVYPVKGKGLACTTARPPARCGSSRSRSS